MGLFSGFPYPPDGTIGYSSVRLTDETITKYSARLIWLRTLDVCKGNRRAAHISPGPKRILTGCDCKDITFGHVQWGIVAPLICGKCRGQYKRLPRDGDRNPSATMAQINGVALSTAQGWVTKARDRGLLPPGRRGRAG